MKLYLLNVKRQKTKRESVMITLMPVTLGTPNFYLNTKKRKKTKQKREYPRTTDSKCQYFCLFS